jgi:hypothetical protein
LVGRKYPFSVTWHHLTFFLRDGERGFESTAGAPSRPLSAIRGMKSGDCGFDHLIIHLHGMVPFLASARAARPAAVSRQYPSLNVTRSARFDF